MKQSLSITTIRSSYFKHKLLVFMLSGVGPLLSRRSGKVVGGIATFSGVALLLATLCSAQSVVSPTRVNRYFVASLRVHPSLACQRTSPTPKQADGPVLYQLIFGGSGAPNTVAKFDTNTRHLTSSLIMDNGSIVAVNAFSINGSTGIVTFAPGQTFGTATLALNANNLGGFAPSHYQLALNLSCPSDSAVTSIASNGQAQCGSTLPPPQTAPPVNLIFSGQVFYLSIIAGKDGFPMMSYEDANGVPHFTHCHDYLCGSTSTIVVDSNVTTPGTGTSLYTDSLTGHPVLTYQSGSGNATLKLAQCDSLDCTAPVISTFDSALGKNVGQYNSVCADNSNGIVASYQDGNGFLKFATCSTLFPNTNHWSCGQSSFLLYATPDAANGPVVNTYLGYDALNAVTVAYENTNHQLHVVTCTFNVYNCNPGTGSVQNVLLDTAAYFVNTNVSFVQNSLGNVLITYERTPSGGSQPQQVLISCGSNSSHCTTSATPQALPFTFAPAGPAQITVGNDVLPIIAVLMPTINAVGIYHCSNDTCSAGSVATVNIPGVTSITTIAMTIAGDGFPVIAYSGTNTNLPPGQNVGLGLLHCSNLSCNPFNTLSRR